MMRRSLFALSGRLLSSASVLAQTSRTTPAACEALQTLQVDGVVVTIAKTQWFVAGATGHTGTGAFDGSFQQDQQASLDFAYVAIGAELAKRIIAKNYGKPPAQRRSHRVVQVDAGEVGVQAKVLVDSFHNRVELRLVQRFARDASRASRSAGGISSGIATDRALDKQLSANLSAYPQGAT
jgi:hypothetical protein